ncbi:MAG: hypothetical protein U1E23_08100 [Reyranellaceae bacterium]
MSPLLRELVRAHRNARRPDVRAALAACGLPLGQGPLWGVDFVEVTAHDYQPAPGGASAVIVPWFEDGELLDLVACSLATRACRTRTGLCVALGGEWLDHARQHRMPARLLADPIEWLRNGRRGCVPIDWRAAAYGLSDLPGIAASSPALARRVIDTLSRPLPVPPLFVPETRHAV